MAIYKNITTSGSATTLIDSGRNYSGAISKISISNNSANAATIDIYYYDGTNVFYIVKDIVIPNGVALVLDDNVSFNSAKFKLRIYNTGASPELTVIIR